MLAAELGEHGVQRNGFGDEDGGAQQRAQVKFGGGRHQLSGEVLDVEDADDVIAVIFVDGVSGVAFFANDAQGGGEIGVDGEGDHACARGHDLANRALVEVNHVF